MIEEELIANFAFVLWDVVSLGGHFRFAFFPTQELIAIVIVLLGACHTSPPF